MAIVFAGSLTPNLAVTGSEQRDEWADRAACKDADPNLFFHPSGKGTRSYYKQGLALCRDCPTLVECGEYAEHHQFDFGLWGGRIRDSSPERRGRPSDGPFAGNGADWCSFCNRQVGSAQMGRRNKKSPMCKTCLACYMRSWNAGKLSGKSVDQVRSEVIVLCRERRWDDNRRR